MVLGRDGSIWVMGGERQPFVPLGSVEILTAPRGSGDPRPMLADCDGDGDVDFQDLLCLLSNWTREPK
jgi:hypothetical protein